MYSYLEYVRVLAVVFQGVHGISPSSTHPPSLESPIISPIPGRFSPFLSHPSASWCHKHIEQRRFLILGVLCTLTCIFWCSPPHLHHLASKQKAPVSSIPGLFSWFFFNSRPSMYVQCSHHSRLGFARLLCCQTIFWKCHTASHHISPPSLMPIAPERIAL